MRVTTYTSWSFRTYRITAKCKCSKCGKYISKTFSFDCREDVSPTKEDWDNLEERRKEWLAEEHICNSCKCESVKQERHDITSQFKDTFFSICSIQGKINDLNKSKTTFLDDLKSQLKGKILIDKDKNEWVISSVYNGYENCLGFEIFTYKINKQKPWLCTDESRYFYKADGDPLHYFNFTLIDDCIITDEDFNSRKGLLK